MFLATSKNAYRIDLNIGLDSEDDFRAFRQILREWLDDHSGNSSSVTFQNAKSMARQLLAAVKGD